MEIKLLVLALMVAVLLPFCGNNNAPGTPDNSEETEYFNLDFEDTFLLGKELKPKLWRYYVLDPNIFVTVDNDVFYSGKTSLKIERKPGTKKAVAFRVTSYIPSGAVKGKTLEVTAFIKTDNVENGQASLRVRVDGKNWRILENDEMENHGATGTTPWNQYTLEMQVPPEAVSVAMGPVLTGTGSAWFDSFKVSIDGKPYKQVKPVPPVPTEQDLEWIRKTAIPFKTDEPIDDHSDLASLKKMIGNRRIVALGEATHGTREFNRMRHRMVKFLAEEMDFTFFAVEASMTQARAVNRYILTGEGNPKEALKGLIFFTIYTREFLDMIEWMREFNTSGKGRIEFYGLDMQDWDLAAENVTRFVEKADKDFVEPLAKHYQVVKDLWYEYRRKKIWDAGLYNYDNAYNEARKVVQYLNSNREKYLKLFEAREVDLIIQDANIVMMSNEIHVKGKRFRDECMADNLDWILKYQPAGTKIITWAHNIHVSRGDPQTESVGYFLDKRYGDDMMVFGFSYFEGQFTSRRSNGLTTYSSAKTEPGSLPWYLKSSGIPKMILDTRGATNGEKGAQWLNRELMMHIIGGVAPDYGFYLVNIPKEFDAIVYFEKTTPSESFRSKAYLEMQKNKTN